MKIYAISDLHLTINSDKPMDVFGGAWENYLEKIKADWLEKVTDEDVVLIAGDISWAMKLSDAIDDLNWIGALPGKKIMIRGNHDYWWKSPSSIRTVLPEGMFLIQNDSLKLGKFVFAGTRGWTVPEYKDNQTEEDKKIFNREILRLEMSLKSATDQLEEGDELVAMIHYPPFNSRLEDNEFTALFEKYNVKKVIYGHLHGTDGKYVLQHSKNDVTYFLTSCDIVKNKIIEIK